MCIRDRDWARRALPWTWRSRPGRRFRSATRAWTSPVRIVVGSQVAPASVRVCEATYFGRPLRTGAKGWSVIRGQSRAKFSYVRRPRRKASASPSQSPATCSNAASRCGTNQPPRVNPSLVSSSGAPGPWETPSSVRNSCTTSFIVDRSFGACDDGSGRTPVRRAGVPPAPFLAGGGAGRRAQSSRWTFVLDACARGRTTSRSMLTWLGRVTAQPIVSATSSAVSGAATPA